MISLDFSSIELQLKQQDDKTYVFDPVRKRWIILTREEHVRQYFLLYLIQVLGYPGSLISVEKKILLDKVSKRFDVVVYNRNHEPWMLIECKDPQVIISEKTLFQLLDYHSVIPCKYWVLTNGHQTFCADANDVNSIKWMDHLPLYCH